MEGEQIDRQKLLENSKAYRQKLEEVLTKIPEEDYLLPNVVGKWSIKDTLAHLASWEQLMVSWLTEAEQGQTPDTPETDEEVEVLNTDMYRQNKDLSLEDVLGIFKRSFPQALSAAENTSDELLFNPNPMEGRKEPFWIMVAANMWWHYKEHYEDISKWLEEKSG